MARVIILDDEENIRIAFGEILTGEGHEVHTASNSVEAYWLLNESNFDVVVADINLGGLSGIEFLSYMKKSYGDVEVIIITGLPTKETAQKALSGGAFAYLSKPISAEKICTAVNRAARKKGSGMGRDRA